MTDAPAEPAPRLVTGEAVDLGVRPASFLLRAAGSLIDAVIYLGGYLLIALVITLNAPAFLIDDAVGRIVAIVLLVLALVVAPTAVEALSLGRSAGRLAVGVRIVRDDGGAIGFRHAFIRALVGLLDFFSTLGGMAVLVGLLDERSRRLGDLIAGTYAQNERAPRHGNAAFGVPLELAAWAWTADVAALPDALSRRIAQFLEHAARLTPASRIRVAADLAREASAYVAPLPVAPDELFLAAVLVVRREREASALAGETARLARVAPALELLPHGFPTRD
ncbi:RDD family protein [Galbitalea sp. SE-J8]|uniref:RDD family protein n=1 Tax=Galbitalea sp. SE-J8 TaxID=3054952 RepID=UPI00259CDDE7|nr:RDD family protein [Galbitalea sp. SE-J8]MDM4762712.1 RDD family protein [Galbitalea sp. SE-J8]